MSAYRITITNPGGKTGDAAGFVDQNRVEQYLELTTKEDAQNKMRGLIRYRNILGSIGLITTYDVDLTIAQGSTATSDASEFIINMRVRDDSALVDGEYQGADALRERVAKGMAVTRTTLSDYYDPAKISETLPFEVEALGTLDECRAMVAVEVI